MDCDTEFCHRTVNFTTIVEVRTSLLLELVMQACALGLGHIRI